MHIYRCERGGRQAPPVLSPIESAILLLMNVCGRTYKSYHEYYKQILYCTMPYCTVPYCTVPYCTVIYIYIYIYMYTTYTARSTQILHHPSCWRTWLADK